MQILDAVDAASLRSDIPAQVQTQLVQLLQKELSTDAVTAAEEAEP